MLLLLAAAYTLTWGVVMIVAPDSYYAFSGLDASFLKPDAKTWGMLSLLAAVLYVGFVVMPLRMALVVVPGVIFTGVGLVLTGYWYVLGYFTPEAAGIQVAGDGIGLVGFVVATAEVYKGRRKMHLEESVGEPMSASGLLGEAETHMGEYLYEISARQPMLLVFLRHFGCTFCREALVDLFHLHEKIRAVGVQVVVVHMVADDVAKTYLEHYGLGYLPRVSDPAKRLYGAFELKQGTFGQLMGIETWVEGFRAGVMNGRSIGKEVGDSSQMPGIFLVHKGEVVKAFRHATASTRPDYCAMAECAEE